MSTGLIVLIVVAAVLLIALFAVMPAMRRRRAERRHQERLERRRTEVVDHHRGEAEARTARADLAEREARHARAEAELHEARADLHERGLADDELMADERTGRDERIEPDARHDDPVAPDNVRDLPERDGERERFEREETQTTGAVPAPAGEREQPAEREYDRGYHDAEADLERRR